MSACVVGLLCITGLFCFTVTIEDAKAAETGFDGSYKGPANSSSGGECRDFNPTMKVEGGAFSIRYNGSLTLTGTVVASGTVTGQGTAIYGRGTMSTSNMTGKIAGGVATLTSDSPICHYDLKLTKLP